MEAGTGNVNDLAALSTLDEKTLLQEICLRFKNNVIYTYIGDVLIAVNPYKPVLIYGPEYADQYKELQFRNEQPPHIYQVSDSAYQGMKRTGQNQCCVVSGESGAGKTESTKLMIQHISHLCREDNADLHKKIVLVNPLLEAFGNAQTVMNNNSSRFGKYIELKFDAETKLCGARISEYLLEKSRVVSQGPGEKNFHIFYYMFAGLTQEQLGFNLLYKPQDHRILIPVDGTPIFFDQEEFLHHQDMWDKLRDIMNVVGFTSDEVQAILAILAAVLHITDIRFVEDLDIGGVYMENEEPLAVASELLALSEEELAGALISTVRNFRGERIVSLKNIYQANDSRDALAKALYGRLFGWIVRQINLILQPRNTRTTVGPKVGILDIAGFENFQHNGFEQLCINSANEQLQFYFNQHIFQWELDEYKKEGIKAKDIKFIDNRPLIDLFLEMPVGLYSLLDEESRFPNASDATLLEKLSKNLGKKSHFIRPKGPGMVFTINHYAGPVNYNVIGFLEKNRDTVSTNLLECMMNSESQFMCDLFFAPISDTGSLLKTQNGPVRSRKSVLLCKPPNPKTESLSRKAGKKLKAKAHTYGNDERVYENTVTTLGMHFRNSLADLMRKLLDADPHFIRCIKPNSEKLPELLNDTLVRDQLRYTGVLETVKIRRQGYPTRLTFDVFLKRYKILAYNFTHDMTPSGSACNKVLKKTGLKEYEIGKNKVFLKYWHVEQLNSMLSKLDQRAARIQALVRGFLGRLRWKQIWSRHLNNKHIVQTFCYHANKMTDDKYIMLANQQQHDLEKYKHREQSRLDQLRRNQAQLRPQSNAPPTQAKPLVNGTSRQVNPTKPKGVFMPTPIILGNPVYGDPNPVAAKHKTVVSPGGYDPSVYTQEGQMTMEDALSKGYSYKRTPGVQYSERNTYPTETMGNRGRSAGYNNTSHLRREPTRSKRMMSPAPPANHPIARSSSKAFLFGQLQETLSKFPELDEEVWGKLIYIEKNRIVQKVYLRENEVIVDDSKEEFDGKVIGLRAFENQERDNKSQAVIKKVGKGVKLSRDSAGNVFMYRQSDSDVICKGYKNPENTCYSEDVVQSLGRLPKKKMMKVFSMDEYKSQIALELQKPHIDSERLQSLSMFSLAFGRNTFDDFETPCWVAIINFMALDKLGNDKDLAEFKTLARLNISDADEAQLRRNWSRLYVPRGLALDDMEIENGDHVNSRPTSAEYTSSLPNDNNNEEDKHSPALRTGRKEWAKTRVCTKDTY